MNKLSEMWDSRYSQESYAYGTEPNAFLKQSIEKHNLSGSILLPAEGEGRNAVYAAQFGLETWAFDISMEGRNKALKLAEQSAVSINYQVGEFFDLDLAHKQFDSAALIYAHFPPPLLSAYNQKVASLIKPNGLVILEGFSKNHLPYRSKNPGVGGPDKLEMLFSMESIKSDFSAFEIIQLEEVEVPLSEGLYHQGTGSVIRFIGKKNHSI